MTDPEARKNRIEKFNKSAQRLLIAALPDKHTRSVSESLLLQKYYDIIMQTVRELQDENVKLRRQLTNTVQEISVEKLPDAEGDKPRRGRPPKGS